MDTKLIRFHDWLIDKNEISSVEIVSKKTPESEYDEIEHNVVVTMKKGNTLSITCYSLYNARKQLDYLTCNTNADIIGDAHGTYIGRQVYLVRQCINDLTEQINKLMRDYKKKAKLLKGATKCQSPNSE